MGNRIAVVYGVAYHRNGSGGVGFYAVHFKGTTQVDSHEFLATVFKEQGCCAVIALDLVPTEGVGHGNKWRGDAFEPELRRGIKTWEDAEDHRLGLDV